MSFLRHIAACNAFRPELFVPLFFGAQRVGTLRRDNADALRQFPDLFDVSRHEVRIIAEGDDTMLTRRIDEAAEQLMADGLIKKMRNEFFAIVPRWGDKALFMLDRGAMGFFGARAYGVHMNGYCRDNGAYRLWIGRRDPTKQVAPGKLDNLVAGGIGHGLGARATLVKEAEEEASIAAPLIDRANAVGVISYRMETPRGLRDDILFLYDLETPADFVPRNNDGEIVEFFLMDARDVLTRVRDTDDFKFNVNLVIIDFALRHGLITPEDRDYVALATGLHRRQEIQPS
jgi:8-oxo-dGTP pyrophosphatase MutT (NUDIX family)